MKISLVVATDLDGVIGRDNRLPWRLPADLRHFKRTTLGKPVVMGRRTFESIGKPLVGRTNIVLTRDAAFAAEGVLVARSVDEALRLAAPAAEVMVIGGAAVYRAFLPRAERIYWTLVQERFEGDTRLPPFDPAVWSEVERVDAEPDAHNPYPYSFRVLERRDVGARARPA